MNIKFNSLPLVEFRELNSGDCFVWVAEDGIGQNVFMKIGNIETNEGTIENACVELETGEVNILGFLYSDSLVLLVELNATAELLAN